MTDKQALALRRCESVLVPTLSRDPRLVVAIDRSQRAIAVATRADAPMATWIWVEWSCVSLEAP